MHMKFIRSESHRTYTKWLIKKKKKRIRLVFSKILEKKIKMIEHPFYRRFLLQGYGQVNL